MPRSLRAARDFDDQPMKPIMALLTADGVQLTGGPAMNMALPAAAGRRAQASSTMQGRRSPPGEAVPRWQQREVAAISQVRLAGMRQIQIDARHGLPCL